MSKNYKHFFAKAYRNKVIEDQGMWQKMIPRNYTKNDKATFEEFLTYLIFHEEDIDGDIDVHIKPYWHQVMT